MMAPLPNAYKLCIQEDYLPGIHRYSRKAEPLHHVPGTHTHIHTPTHTYIIQRQCPHTHTHTHTCVCIMCMSYSLLLLLMLSSFFISAERYFRNVMLHNVNYFPLAPHVNAQHSWNFQDSDWKVTKCLKENFKFQTRISRKWRPLSTCETSHWKEEAKIRISEKFWQGFPSEEE